MLLFLTYYKLTLDSSHSLFFLSLFFMLLFSLLLTYIVIVCIVCTEPTLLKSFIVLLCFYTVNVFWRGLSTKRLYSGGSIKIWTKLRGEQNIRNTCRLIQHHWKMAIELNQLLSDVLSTKTEHYKLHKQSLTMTIRLCI